ncbi:hypothetical protein NLI96_g5303 [Meripilus lineatus]|uniref:Uncharacterized protein n=1 Tax=Meripilus lineatus TaxID=2056292 RepID=A0AAD5V312_9APHY|nr:hypothetical protein NLI96_g5303 [Physisporinus lineatus]
MPNSLQSITIPSRPSDIQENPIDELTWITIGGSLESVPPADSTILPMDSNELLCSPRLYNSSNPHFPFIPDARRYSNPERLSWVFQPLTALYPSDSQENRLEVSLAKTIEDHFKSVRAVIADLSEEAGTDLKHFDDGFQARIFTDAEGLDSIQHELMKAKQTMLLLLGAGKLGLALASSEKRRSVVEAHSAYLLSWDWTLPVVGAVMDFETPRSMNLPVDEFKERRVPIYIRIRSSIVERALASRRVAPEGGSAEPGENRLHSLPTSPNRDHAEGITEENQTLPPPPTQATDRDSLIEEEQLSLLDVAENLLSYLPEHAPYPSGPPPSYSWSPLMKNNCFVVLEPLTEIKLRLKAAEGHYSAANLLTYAARRGMPFHLVVPLHRLSRMIPSDFPESEGRPPYLNPSYVDPPLYHDPNPVSAWAVYCVRVLEILDHPHAVGAIYEGGVPWRVAVQFAGPRILRALHVQVSTTVSRFCRGRCTIRGYLGDELSRQELHILLGVHIDSRSGAIRSWWPSQELYEECLGKRGEWYQEDEEWFSERYERSREAILSAGR